MPWLTGLRPDLQYSQFSKVIRSPKLYNLFLIAKHFIQINDGIEGSELFSFHRIHQQEGHN